MLVEITTEQFVYVFACLNKPGLIYAYPTNAKASLVGLPGMVHSHPHIIYFIYFCIVIYDFFYDVVLHLFVNFCNSIKFEYKNINPKQFQTTALIASTVWLDP